MDTIIPAASVQWFIEQTYDHGEVQLPVLDVFYGMFNVAFGKERKVEVNFAYKGTRRSL